MVQYSGDQPFKKEQLGSTSTLVANGYFGASLHVNLQKLNNTRYFRVKLFEVCKKVSRILSVKSYRNREYFAFII